MAIIKMTFRTEHDHPWKKRMLEKYFGPLLHVGIDHCDTNIYVLNIPSFSEDEEVFIYRMSYTPSTDSAKIEIRSGINSIEIF